MKPCEKYMLDSSENSVDICFKPFNPSSYIPNFQNTPLLPMMFWENLVINPVSGGVNQFPIPYIDTSNKNILGNTMTGYNYTNTETYNNMNKEDLYNNSNMINYNTSSNIVTPINSNNSKYENNFSNFNQFSNTDTSHNVPSYDVDYPNETSESNLYSYNKNNSSSPMSTTSKYDSINVDVSNSEIIEVLKSLDASLNESSHLMRNINDNRINDIYKDIVNEDSNILSLLNAYRIPKPISKLILTRTIKTTLNYSDNISDKNKVGE